MFSRNTAQRTNQNLYRRGLRNGFFCAVAATVAGLGVAGIAEYFNSANDMETITLGVTGFTSSLIGSMAQNALNHDRLAQVHDKQKGLRDASLAVTGASLLTMAAINAPKLLQVFQP
ncbi:MAG: hypothetical protein AAGB32_01080 [Pseudomonadota bacterium]